MATNITNLTKAKASLIIDHPFFASILLGLPIIEDKTIDTLNTNGEEIRYNPDYVASRDLSGTIFDLAHETLHCVLMHMHRRGSMEPNKFNAAADFVINDLLVNEKIGSISPNYLYDPALVKQGGGSTEGVYKILPDSYSEKKAGKKGSGGSHDEVTDAGKDQAETAAKEADMRVKVVQAANAAKMCGKLSAGMARIVGEATESRIDWKAVLRRFMSEKAKVDLSYAKPKRRFMADDILLPSLTGEKMGEVVYAVDTSGSIGEELLRVFSGEMNSIKSEVNPSRIHVVYFDSSVVKHDTFESDDELRVSPCGGGGTAFSPIFRFIDEQGINPVACVVLTDLCCDDFGPAPAYPVLWASTHRGSAPFGETVFIRE